MFERDSVDLNECIHELKYRLEMNEFSVKYGIKNIERIKQKFPKVATLLELESVSGLNKKECEMLLKCLKIYCDIIDIEQYEIFLLGMGQAYKFFRKTGIIE